MRESYGGTWTFQLVITFVLLFTAFLAITVNYARAYRMKNEMLGFIERSEGFTSSSAYSRNYGARQLINNFLDQNSHDVVGKCPAGWKGVSSLTNGLSPETANGTDEYIYCVNKTKGYSDLSPEKAYYEVMMFFDFNLPIIGKIYTFKVTGTTKQVQNPADNDVWR